MAKKTIYFRFQGQKKRYEKKIKNILNNDPQIKLKLKMDSLLSSLNKLKQMYKKKRETIFLYIHFKIYFLKRVKY